MHTEPSVQPLIKAVMNAAGHLRVGANRQSAPHKSQTQIWPKPPHPPLPLLRVGKICMGISSQNRAKFLDWAVFQARAGCDSQAALSSNDSKTL